MKKVLSLLMVFVLLSSGVIQAQAATDYNFCFIRDYWIGRCNNYFFSTYDYDNNGSYIVCASAYQTTGGIGVGVGSITKICEHSSNTWCYHVTCQLKLMLAWYIGFDIGKYHRDELDLMPGTWEATPLDDWSGR